MGEPECRDADEPPDFEHVQRASSLAYEVWGWSEAALIGNASRREQPYPIGPEEPAGCVREVTSICILGEEAHRAVPLRAGQNDSGDQEGQQGL